MADIKTSALTALTGATLASGDLIMGVDVSDTTMGASGTNKKITAGELLIGLASISSGVTLGSSLTLSNGTQTTSKPVLDLSQTWNDAVVTFTGFKFNIANTASATGSAWADFQLGGTSLFSVKPAGGGLLAGAPSLQVGTGATAQRGWIFGTISSSLSGMWITGVTISSSNYVLANNNATTFLQAPTSTQFNINGVDKAFLNASNFRLDSAHIFGWSETTASTALDTGWSKESAGLVQINNGTANAYRDLKVRKHYVDQTITAAGTTGAQTINKAAGTVNFAAAATSLVVTNSLVTTSSTIYVSMRTADDTARIAHVVPAAGSFTITLTAAATAETSVGFLVIN